MRKKRERRKGKNERNKSWRDVVESRRRRYREKKKRKRKQCRNFSSKRILLAKETIQMLKRNADKRNVFFRKYYNWLRIDVISILLYNDVC